MVKKLIFCFCFILFTVQLSLSARSFRTEVFSDKIKTLRVSVVDNWELPPIIQLEGNNIIEVSFDVLGASPEAYTYTLTHCNADWTPSQLIQSEYMSGFQNTYIDDYANSFNTRMDYVNYRVCFPNENLTMKVSGNYVVRIFHESDSNTPVLNACFSVVEQDATVKMNVSSKTDKGVNRFYQQVNFEIAYGNDVKSPMQDLKVYVFQNNRTDNQASLVKPLNILNKKAVYDHVQALIFDGGNEYRSFEMVTTKYVGLNIESVEYHAPYYHSILKPAYNRSGRSYSYNEDINGRFLIRNKDAIEHDYEADYQFVHFYLPSEKPLPENVYILSEAFHNILDARTQMEYSQADKGYIKTVLMKEGYYNYLYVTRKNNAAPGSTVLIEGNHYETENEYRVHVYFRPMGGRYDKLIAVQSVEYK